MSPRLLLGLLLLVAFTHRNLAAAASLTNNAPSPPHDAPTPHGVSDLRAFDRVDIARTKTSIYIGSVSMTLPTLVRENGTYSAPYAAKVFPYFFANEKGILSIKVTDAMLRQLADGHPIEFEGHGVNTTGETRRVSGRALPTNARSGTIKVRVSASKRIELIFNTTYRFPDL